MDSVWVPHGHEWDDGDYPGWVEMRIDLGSEEFFWFASEEACQAECDRRNAVSATQQRDGYAAYLQEVESDNRRHLRSYQQRLREHEALVAAGLRTTSEIPQGAVRPPVDKVPLSFERWEDRSKPWVLSWAPVEFKGHPSNLTPG